MKRIALWLAGCVLACVGELASQQTTYTQNNLVANISGTAPKTDPQLSNPWGIAFIPGNPFWIANNNGGTLTIYDATGNKLQPTVTIPVAANNACPQGCPTGLVANSGTAFGGAQFIAATEDGLITKWNGLGASTIAVDNSSSGAVYKGLAILSANSGNLLLVANFHSGKIDVFDGNFQPATLPGGFTDPGLTAGFAPHGVHVISGTIYVTFAQQDTAKHDPVIAAGSGVLDTFDANGKFLKRVITGGSLNAPWGVALAPSTFGGFSGALLVGNFGDGAINAYDRNSGTLLGQLMDSSNKPILNPGLWDMVFGQGGTGDPSTLYITAGGSDQTHGLFAALAATAANGPDFSLAAAQQSITVPRGGSATVQMSASAIDGFSGTVALTCSTSAGISCSISPTSISPGGKANVQVTASSSYMAAALVVGPTSLSIFGCLFVARRRRFTGWAGMAALVVVGILMAISVACGSGSSTNSPTGGAANLTVTGTSGSISHSVQIPLTVQ